MHTALMALALVATPVPASADVNADVNEAIERVKQIVNQPVQSYPRDPSARVTVYSPGWFHPGAIEPDFRNVDVRRTQDLSYGRREWVTSDVNPGVMFRGADVEFNAMTKYFYTDRSLPKKRLTEEEMLEINRLYRVIATRPASNASTAATTGAAAATRWAPTLGYGSATMLLLASALWLSRRRSAGAR
jgi:hypothetical protein